jgi:hypothetical protein
VPSGRGVVALGEGRSGQGGGFTAARVNVNVNVKMLLRPAPQKFTTFNTFTTFAKFAKFANFNSALEYPALIHRQALRVRSVWDRALSRRHAPSPQRTGRGG